MAVNCDNISPISGKTDNSSLEDPDLSFNDISKGQCAGPEVNVTEKRTAPTNAIQNVALRLEDLHDLVPAENASGQPDGRLILSEEAGYGSLGFNFPTWKKWAVLTSIFVVQITMNFNAAIYANAVPGIGRQFHITESKARLGQFIFLVAYAFGCELWAPWSEELGRKWVLQGSLFLVNVWQIPCALAPNFWTIFGFRLLGGLSSAGGSVTLGMVADMWEPAYQQYAVAYVVLSSVAGSVVAPIIGGFITQYLRWQWVFWMSLIFGGVAQAIHFFVPETRSSVILTKKAEGLRKKYPGCEIYSEDEVKGSFWQRLEWKQSCKLMWRPYQFLFTEPIVAFLSLLSGFSDALIFTGLDSFGLVLNQWHFNYVTKGFCFVPLLIGCLITYASFLPVYRHDRSIMQGDTSKMRPERRLWWLLYLVPLMPIGLFGFAWCSQGPPIHWFAPLFFTALIGIANLAIYMATIDYMVAAYGPYAASATGGNGFCRDFLAGIAALYAFPFYSNIARGTRFQLVIPTLILSGIAVLGCIPVYYFFFKGDRIRAKSKYASELEQERIKRAPKRAGAISRLSTSAGSRNNSKPPTPRMYTLPTILEHD